MLPVRVLLLTKYAQALSDSSSVALPMKIKQVRIKPSNKILTRLLGFSSGSLGLRNSKLSMKLIIPDPIIISTLLNVRQKG